MRFGNPWILVGISMRLREREIEKERVRDDPPLIVTEEEV